MTRTVTATSDRSFSVALALCCGASLIPLWLVGYPPMADLPQHAAQVATSHRWGVDGAFDYSQVYWINWLTPYIVSRSLAYLLSTVVSILTAYKLVISLALVGLPVSTLALLRETRGNPWWSLAAVPLGYSFAFYMGFVAFSVAVPLALYLVLLSWRHAEEPTRRRGWLVFLLLQLLFVTHVLAFGWAGLVGALVTAARSPGWRALVRRWIPFLGAAVLPASWVLVTLHLESSSQSGPWGSIGWERIPELPALLVGLPPGPWSVTVGSLLVLLPFATGGRPSRQFARWVPLLVSLSLYFGSPSGLFGTALIQKRYAMLTLPTLLFALDWRGVRQRSWRSGVVLAAATAVWLVHLGFLFRSFDAETGSLAKLVADAPADSRILYLALDRESESIPYPVYLHFGQWVQVERGGVVDYSFAEIFPNRFRYLPEANPALPVSIEWRPHALDWHRDGGEIYDYLLLRSTDRAAALDFVRNLHAPLVPTARADGGWWLFANAARVGKLKKTPDAGAAPPPPPPDPP